MEKNKHERIIEIINGNEYEVIPTERGYAYIISVALSITIVCLFSHMNSLALLFHDVLIEIGSGTNGMTMILAVLCINVSISGLIANVALKRFSLRQVGLFAAIIYTCGWLLMSFVQNIYHVITAFGFMCAFGSGMLFTISFASFNSYFSEKRMMILSFIQFITSSITMIYPLIIEKLLQKYNSRGTLLIISAFMSHLIFAVICFHPVEWHSTVRLCYEPVKNDKDIKEDDAKEITNNDESQIGNTIENDLKCRGFKNKIMAVMDFLNLSLLKDLVLLNLLIAVSLSLLIDNTFFVIFPLYLFDLKFSVAEVAGCATILGASDLCGRAFLVIFCKFFKISSELIVYSALVLTTLTRIAFFFCSSHTSLKLITLILGFLRAFVQSLNTVVVADYIPENFSAALSLMMLIPGVINFPLMTIFGFLHSNTGSYLAGYIFLATTNALCLIPWTFKLLRDKIDK
ncbi:uncharacterized protein LOC143918025 isoform X1 [Arctopsyche grandis]|uniref:uncharacterized protein LOC143918025 isoform X1 n=1 Tax=Arctopsyche grandis TaxID=121162 RepID=UPI00406D96D2